MANSGVSKLAQVIAERIAVQTQKPDALELGTIQKDMSLKLDRFAVPIPKGDYLVADWHLKLEFPKASRTVRLVGIVNKDGSETATTAYSRPVRIDFLPTDDPQATIHIHASLKPELKPGDRVLVAWVNDHKDPVILSKVVSS